jgi:hypothetical protein
MYQLCVGDESLASVIDRIAEAACAVAPGLERESCRHLVELVFRARVRKTEACGKHPECKPRGSVWGHAAPRQGDSCGWEDLDPQGLPTMFGVAAADLAGTDDRDRRAVEERLARAFHGVLAGLLFCNPHCGSASVCRAEPVYSLGKPRSGTDR